jgi:hypothetical protein
MFYNERFSTTSLLKRPINIKPNETPTPTRHKHGFHFPADGLGLKGLPLPYPHHAPTLPLPLHRLVIRICHACPWPSGPSGLLAPFQNCVLGGRSPSLAWILRQTRDAPVYAAGTIALSCCARSCQPLICCTVRMNMREPGRGTPYLPIKLTIVPVARLCGVSPPFILIIRLDCRLRRTPSAHKGQGIWFTIARARWVIKP